MILLPLANHLPFLGLSFHLYNEDIGARPLLLWTTEPSSTCPLGQPRNPAKGWGHLLGGLGAPTRPLLVLGGLSFPLSAQLPAAVPQAQAESPAWRVSG